MYADKPEECAPGDARDDESWPRSARDDAKAEWCGARRASLSSLCGAL